MLKIIEQVFIIIKSIYKHILKIIYFNKKRSL